jgi:uncharacterized protein YchJ
MTKEKIECLRSELLLKLNAIGGYKTYKELWDAFYNYEDALLSTANIGGYVKANRWMKWFRWQYPKMERKRNSLCSCGSGKKYKYCCLNNYMYL